MPIAYASAVQGLYALGHELHGTGPAPKFDLELVRVLLRELGEPQRRFASVLIAGTNGKGSTAATLAAIAAAAGHRTGLYTSPHLLRVNERVRVLAPGKAGAEEEISETDFACRYEQVETTVQRLLGSGALPWHPSFFEMLTAMAFLHFAAVPVELAVLEVGMGGRLDATNVVAPLLSVITDISLDHQKFLGDTVGAIAREKAGIIRPGGVVVTLPQHPEANQVIGSTVLECGARMVSAVEYMPAKELNAEGARDAEDAKAAAAGRRNRYPARVRGKRILVDSPLWGQHQWRNLALAMAAAEELNRAGIDISPDDIEAGIRQTRWPGRFEVRAAQPERDRPEIVLDAAHNPAGAWALRAALSQRYQAARKLVLVFGAMRDKAIAEVAQILFPLVQQVVATRARNPRSAEVEEIRALTQGICKDIQGEDGVSAALERARRLAGSEGVVVVAGSIYVVGEAMEALQGGGKADPSRAEARSG